MTVERTYRRLATVYDALYARAGGGASKDFQTEARRVLGFLRRHQRSPGRALLDVACGTGQHLRYFRRVYDCTGVDASREMLREAHRTVPEVRLVRASMEDFRLSRQFDAITCLGSAIGYVRTRAGLARTLQNFATHLRPGGVAIVEPWLTPRSFIPGSVGLDTVDSPGLKIARVSRPTRRGRLSIVEMQYLVVRGRGTVRHWVERHEL